MEYTMYNQDCSSYYTDDAGSPLGYEDVMINASKHTTGAYMKYPWMKDNDAITEEDVSQEVLVAFLEWLENDNASDYSTPDEAWRGFAKAVGIRHLILKLFRNRGAELVTGHRDHMSIEGYVYLDDSIVDDDDVDVTYHDIIDSKMSHPEILVARRQSDDMKADIISWMFMHMGSRLDPTTQRILVDYFGLESEFGMSGREVAEKYGITQQSVNKRIAKAMCLMRADKRLSALNEVYWV